MKQIRNIYIEGNDLGNRNGDLAHIDSNCFGKWLDFCPLMRILKFRNKNIF